MMLRIHTSPVFLFLLGLLGFFSCEAADNSQDHVQVENYSDNDIGDLIQYGDLAGLKKAVAAGVSVDRKLVLYDRHMKDFGDEDDIYSCFSLLKVAISCEKPAIVAYLVNQGADKAPQGHKLRALNRYLLRVSRSVSDVVNMYRPLLDGNVPLELAPGNVVVSVEVQKVDSDCAVCRSCFCFAAKGICDTCKDCKVCQYISLCPKGKRFSRDGGKAFCQGEMDQYRDLRIGYQWIRYVFDAPVISGSEYSFPVPFIAEASEAYYQTMLESLMGRGILVQQDGSPYTLEKAEARREYLITGFYRKAAENCVADLVHVIKRYVPLSFEFAELFFHPSLEYADREISPKILEKDPLSNKKGNYDDNPFHCIAASQDRYYLKTLVAQKRLSRLFLSAQDSE